MIVRDHPALSLSRQCRLLSLGRSSLYYEPKGESAETLALMRRIDELFLKYPFYGARRMALRLRREGVRIGRLCCKLGEGAMRNQEASCSPYDSALARRSCSHAMASVRAHGPRPKARSTIRASPTMPPWRANIPAWPLRSARITSKPLIVA